MAGIRGRATQLIDRVKQLRNIGHKFSDKLYKDQGTSFYFLTSSDARLRVNGLGTNCYHSVRARGPLFSTVVSLFEVL